MKQIIFMMAVMATIMWRPSEAAGHDDCPDGFTYFEGTCVYVSACDDKKTFKDAIATCQDHDAYLAEPRTAELSMKFAKLVDNNYDYGTKVYVGAYYNEDQQEWRWDSDGSVTQSIYTSPMYDNTCAVYKCGVLLANDCSEELNYVCVSRQSTETTCLKAVFDITVVTLQTAWIPIENVTVSYTVDGYMGLMGNLKTNSEGFVQLFANNVPESATTIDIHLTPPEGSQLSGYAVPIDLPDNVQSETVELLFPLNSISDVEDQYTATLVWEIPGDMEPVELSLSYLTDSSTINGVGSSDSYEVFSIALPPEKGFLIANVLQPEGTNIKFGERREDVFIALVLTKPENRGGATTIMTNFEGYGSGMWLIGLQPSEGEYNVIGYSILEYFDPMLFEIDVLDSDGSDDEE